MNWKVNQWISFFDDGGYGKAQPDLYCVLHDRVVLIEVKLSQTETGVRQIEDLYTPLLTKLYGLPVVGCLVFKYVTKYVPFTPIENLFTAEDCHTRYNHLVV